MKTAPIVFFSLALFLFCSCAGSGGTRYGERRRSVRAGVIDRGSFSHGRFLQKGIASYYAGEFHGKRTANGETFNKNDLTAAHRTLDFNTRVIVTNLSNNKSVVVRINDRGPFKKGRIIDLSEAAAKEIGLDITGFATVTLEVTK